MERNIVLVGYILEQILREPYEAEKIIDINVDGYPEEVIDYHIMILEEIGYIKVKTDSNGRQMPTHITWKGYDYIESESGSLIEMGLDFFKGFIE